jgi:signal transduction histidine kinase
LINNNNSDGSEVDKEYSYAIYFASERVFNFGNFNYSRNFKANYLEDKRLFESGLTISGFQHRAIKLRDNRVIVVSGLATPVKQLLANVCFIFIMLSGALLLWFLIRGISTNRLRNLSLTTKIQLYLNAAFLLPLLLISVLAISVMSSSYLEDLQSGFQRQAEQIATSLLPNFEKTDGFLSSAQVPLDLYKVSLTTGQEMHLYGPSGVLMASSQPLLLKKQFMSSYVNPQALAAIVEARQNSTLLKESIGAISFTTAYAAIRNPESGAVMALVAVPFFESASQLNHQLSDVIGSMILLFTAMAFLFAILSFYASQQLVVPLRLLTKRIRRTSLERQILPLEWKSKDEIGLLVQEYNRMIANLSKSREVIIKSEKESAWREMARQVAHEIKNPLTPMKLTLQYLKQAIERNHVEVPKITERSINTLLIQIDTLNDIASSFSAFAQMPAPKDELLNLSKIIKDTVVLYSSNHETGVESSIPDMDVPARGDARLLSRIFTNLILNAYQSVPEDVVVQVSVRLELLDSGVARITVEDNGAGISEIHKSRIFQPDFSTKNGGSGIGLAVAKRGIEHLGGKIWFESVVGEGTTFFIELPTLLSGSVVEQL